MISFLPIEELNININRFDVQCIIIPTKKPTNKVGFSVYNIFNMRKSQAMY